MEDKLRKISEELKMQINTIELNKRLDELRNEIKFRENIDKLRELKRCKGPKCSDIEIQKKELKELISNYLHSLDKSKIIELFIIEII